MLNPSKAGAVSDDPTVRKVVGFARRWGYGRAVGVNLNPIVSTDPWDLPYWNGIDCHNLEVIQRWIGVADLVVAAWGSQPRALGRKIGLTELIYAFRGIAPVAVHCIGVTRSGDPLHPSRAPYTAAPELWAEP